MYVPKWVTPGRGDRGVTPGAVVYRWRGKEDHDTWRRRQELAEMYSARGGLKVFLRDKAASYHVWNPT